jgi:hypothetical protein
LYNWFYITSSDLYKYIVEMKKGGRGKRGEGGREEKEEERVGEKRGKRKDIEE